MGPRNDREPDLVVFPRRTVTQKLADAGAGDVLLVAELMSPSSVTDDRLVKPAQDARAGIAHYWRIEQAPSAAPVLITHRLEGDRYRETGRFADEVRTGDAAPMRLRLGDLLT